MNYIITNQGIISRYVQRHFRRHPESEVNHIQKINTALNGKKTYIVCIATIIYSILAAYLKFITWQQAIENILAALAAAGFRSAMN